jgi:hypothetical protein
MPDGYLAPIGPPLLMDERTAARFVSMTPRDFRVAVSAGLLPAPRAPADFASAGLITPAQAARLATLRPLWHRLEIEARLAHLFGLEGQARFGQAHRKAAAREALDAYTPPGSAALRPARPNQ